MEEIDALKAQIKKLNAQATGLKMRAASGVARAAAAGVGSIKDIAGPSSSHTD